MRLTHFFIDRPRFATVLSIFVTAFGLGALAILPVAQYPEIVPPTVQVTTSYPGASAETVARTVATPLEQEINGVENMLYMNSQSTGDGNLTITVTFRIGTDLNVAQMLTQNRVQDVLTRLPEDVQRLGVQVRKAIPSILLAIHLYSPDESRDTLYLSNYATLHIKDVLARLPGVGDVQFQGGREYAMRIWLDPDKAAAYDLTASDVLAALRAQNLQVSAGILNQPPTPSDEAYQINVEALGRLSTPEQFANIIVKSDNRGRVTRVRDIGRVEVGAADYGSTAYMDRSNATTLLIYAEPGANSLAVDHEVAGGDAGAEERLSARRRLRPSSTIRRSSSRSRSTRSSSRFSWRSFWWWASCSSSCRIGERPSFRSLRFPSPWSGRSRSLWPSAYRSTTCPCSAWCSRSASSSTTRSSSSKTSSATCATACRPSQAAHRTMDEVGGALISIALTLCAVFVPSAFISGISGLFFRQFAVTISASTVISCFVSLTLSPALCAVLFKAHYEQRSRTRWPGATAAQPGFRSLQSRLRVALLRLRKLDAPTRARSHHRARGLCRG